MFVNLFKVLLSFLGISSDVASIVQLMEKNGEIGKRIMLLAFAIVVLIAFTAVFIAPQLLNVPPSPTSGDTDEPTIANSPSPSSSPSHFEPNSTVEQINMNYLSKYDVTCSDYLVGNDYDVPYYQHYILDDNLQTAWIENDLYGFGKNEWVQINFDKTYLVSGIKIYNGFHKRDDLLFRNNRIENIEIVFSDGTSIEETLRNSTFGRYDTIDFGKSIATEYIRLVIKSVYQYNYPGEECWDDTCITEVILY